MQKRKHRGLTVPDGEAACDARIHCSMVWYGSNSSCEDVVEYIRTTARDTEGHEEDLTQMH
eukprot:5626488-Pleurochrysis_carterae.AAC.1